MSNITKQADKLDETTSLFDSLEDLGLSSYEARVYYTMLGLGFSTAREVSNQSDIPFGRIYDVLGSLEDKDLIEKQDSRPKKYAVKEPKFALNNLLIRKKKELDSLTTRARYLETHLASLYARDPEEGLFWSVAIDQESIHRHLGKMYEAEEELILYANAQINLMSAGSEKIDDSIMPLIELYERGVSVRVLIGGIANRTQLKPILTKLKKFPDLPTDPVRYTSVVTNTFDIIDGEKVLMKIANPINPTEYFAAIYVWQKRFATELREKFNQMWDEAKELPL